MKAEFLSLFDIPVSRADLSDWFSCSVGRVVSLETFNTKFGLVSGVCVDDWWFRVVWLDDVFHMVGSSISGEKLVQVSVSADIPGWHLFDWGALDWCSPWSSVTLLTSHTRFSTG